jgi:Fur family zinc uptake transcriptional regulator
MHDADSLAFGRHDHEACAVEAMNAARAVCEQRGLRLTPVRARALEILLEGHRALGAYDLLERLKAEGLGSQPPVAYRALDFLVRHGFAHRIEKLNAYVACLHPAAAHDAAFLICRGCGSVAEATVMPRRGALGEGAKRLGFEIERVVVEAEGLCPACRDAAAR